MTEIFDIADRYIDRWAELDPCFALGIAGIDHPDRLTDYSPDGIATRHASDVATLAALGAARPQNATDVVTVANLENRLRAQVARFDAGDAVRDLSALAGPHHAIHETFELMPTETTEDWRLLLDRMALVPAALDGMRATLEEGRRRTTPAARRQVLVAADQCQRWGDPTDGLFAKLVAEAPSTDRADIDRAERAGTALRDLATWLRDDLAPVSEATDGVGPERYARGAALFLGEDLDVLDTYAWGWDELRRINDDMEAVANEIVPGSSVAEAMAALDGDPARAVHGPEALRRWLQDLMDRTVSALDDHFTLSGDQRRIEAMLAAPGSASAPYYTPPSSDGRQPGRTWYPVEGHDEFHTWRQVSTCYHEGVPGHHLQFVAAATGDGIDRVRRLLFTSGHGEGWALYSERLMDELGFLADPGDRLGYLQCQALRAMRVVVDIGLHLHLTLPTDAPAHAGERWNAELALDFAEQVTGMPRITLASEIDRYLGWPGQAISYKVGERVWLDARSEFLARPGATLTAFHNAALGLGHVGLAAFRTAVAAR